MEKTVRINDRFTVATIAPNRDELRAFAGQGFKSVVNMRTDSEPQELPPFEEGGAANEAGLDYLHHPVSGGSLSDHVVDSFREKAPGLPAPILVHCGSGKRSGALVMMHVASEEGMSGDEATRRLEKMGLGLEGPLKQFVHDYVERHNGK